MIKKKIFATCFTVCLLFSMSSSAYASNLQSVVPIEDSLLDFSYFSNQNQTIEESDSVVEDDTWTYTSPEVADEWTYVDNGSTRTVNPSAEAQAKSFEDSITEYYQWLREHPEYKQYADANVIEYSQIESMMSSLNHVPDYNELFQIANQKYGMDERAFNVCLGWSANEGLYEDSYLAYLCACCPINYYMQNGTDGLVNWYSSWAGYSYGLYETKARTASDAARLFTYLALEYLNVNAIGCHGVVKENGYNTTDSINNAWYITQIYCYDLPGGGRVGWYGVF